MLRLLHTTPDWFRHDLPSGRKRKRQRQTLSCITCRNRKVACDREQPCSSCIRHKCIDDCVYSSDNALAVPIQPLPNPHGGQDDAPLGGEAVAPSQDHAVVGPTSAPSHENVFSRGRLARKKEINNRAYYVGPTSWTIVAPFNEFQESSVTQALHKQWKRLIDISASFAVKPHDTILNLVTTAPSTVGNADLLANIPGDVECRVLVNRFLVSSNELAPIVERAAFEHQLDAFLFDRETVSSIWLALLIAIIAVGHVVPVLPLDHVGHSLSREGAEKLARLAQQHAFAASAATHRSPLATLQTLLALVVFKRLSFGWVDGNDGEAGILGLTQRLVFALGIHRDPDTAVQVLPERESRVRRMLFMTYLRLEYMHCLETGMPFLIRTTDYDVHFKNPSNEHVGEYSSHFMHALPVLSRSLHLTHTSRSGMVEQDVKELFRSLSSAAISIQGMTRTVTVPAGALMSTIQSSINALHVHRTHVSLLALLLEQDDTDLRSRLTLDMVTPALEALRHFEITFNAITANATADAIMGWQMLTMSFVRTSIHNVIGYLLAFLHKSLKDPSLLALRGQSHVVSDSSQIFRKVRMALKMMRCTLGISIQCVREHLVFAAHLRSIEERYRLFIEQGLSDVLPTSQEGRAMIARVGEAMDEVFDSTWTVILKDRTECQQYDSNTFADLDVGDQFTLMDNWDLPWTAALPDLHTLGLRPLITPQYTAEWP